MNEIDAFVCAKLEAAGLAPNDRADKLTLLRRVTFDLIGLPPTAEEQEAFLADQSPDAYRSVVNRLLDSPRHGERWAQHWLDLVRYAETEGFKSDKLRPGAYKYRDYVIRSFNADRPYDEFIRQQLAGDELEPHNPEALVATGLNRLYPDEDNAANLFQRRDEILNDVTRTNSLAFLALTMGCAQCHDHKFDGISQLDYFRLRAFFTPMIERDDVAAATPSERQEYNRRYAIWDEATTAIRQEIDALLAESRKKSFDYNLQKFRKEIRECVHKAPADRTPLEEQIARMALKQLAWRFKSAKKVPKADRQRYAELEKQLAEFDSLKPQPLPVAMSVSDVGPISPPSYLLAGGNWRNPEQEVKPRFPSLLGEGELEPRPQSTSMQSTGRRSALARWLSREDHPLTARVMVNRLWQHHFGRGIVATPNDFGLMGQPPTHPELLDWLAVELVQNRWSLKHIHRVMVTSATYCQSSLVDQNAPRHVRALQVDVDNQLLWHARRRRLEGESIRDAMLQISGQLTDRMFGPSARPRLPEGISKRYAWQPDKSLSDQRRRSIYVFSKRNMRFPMFDVFDLPDLHNSCGRRSSTTTAPQALLMLNSELTLELAGHWAARLAEQHGDNLRELVSEAYQCTLGRRASDREIDSACQFLLAQKNRLASPAEAAADGAEHVNRRPSVDAVSDFCHALFNANEFLFVD